MYFNDHVLYIFHEGNFRLNLEKCSFVDWQRLRVQENADEIPPGTRTTAVISSYFFNFSFLFLFLSLLLFIINFSTMKFITHFYFLSLYFFHSSFFSHIIFFVIFSSLRQYASVSRCYLQK